MAQSLPGEARQLHVRRRSCDRIAFFLCVAWPPTKLAQEEEAAVRGLAGVSLFRAVGTVATLPPPPTDRPPPSLRLAVLLLCREVFRRLPSPRGRSCSGFSLPSLAAFPSSTSMKLREEELIFPSPCMGRREIGGESEFAPRDSRAVGGVGERDELIELCCI